MSQMKESEHLKISFREIEIATNNFETCIGKGGYGRVYRGELLISGKLITVAVKRLYEQFGQGSKEFLTEIALLSGQKHPNLISLLGYCEEGKEKILVYEYVERGSLDQYLTHHNTTYNILTWPERLKICVGIARGLEHLHNHVGKHQAIIHRDIKSANILVDHNWVAKISDLGLSKLSLSGLDRSAIITHACGTPGYCEPEYITTGIVTKESDVYSFGMVLLELLCGRLCTIRDDKGLLLLDYFKMNNFHTIIDPSLRKQMSSYSMNKFLKIAYGCLREDRQQRFPMDLVLKELEESLNIELSLRNGEKSNLIPISRGLQNETPKSSFATLIKHRTNVGKIFDLFDINRDGGLSREELVAFLVVTNVNVEYGHEQISALVDEVLCLYDKYLDDKKGLTYHGLLQYYDDGHGDLDSDIAKLVSDSYSNNDDSSRRHKLITIFQKHNHDFAYDGLLKLVLDSKPSDDDEAALWFGSPKSSVMIKLLTNKPVLSWLVITPLVYNTPNDHVTRDIREGIAKLGDLRFKVLDSAGLEAEASSGSVLGRTAEMTANVLRMSNLALFLIDARDGLQPMDLDVGKWLRKHAPGIKIIMVMNKAESLDDGFGSVDAASGEAQILGFGDPIPLSAETGLGMNDLYEVLRPLLEEHMLKNINESVDASNEECESSEQEDESKLPLQLAFVGRPNVGKSTLLNAILQEDRVLVGPEAGLTRDSVRVEFQYEGRTIYMVDTAGWLQRTKSEKGPGSLSVVQSKKNLMRAHVVALVLDGEEVSKARKSMTHDEVVIARRSIEEGRGLVIIVNKMDLLKDKLYDRVVKAVPEEIQTIIPQVAGIPVVFVSALEGKGRIDVMEEVIQTYKKWCLRLSTARLNRWLCKVMSRHSWKDLASQPKVKYFTQVKARPPTFVAFVSGKTRLSDTDLRFLTRSLKEDFDMGGIPVRILQRVVPKKGTTGSNSNSSSNSNSKSKKNGGKFVAGEASDKRILNVVKD